MISDACNSGAHFDCASCRCACHPRDVPVRYRGWWETATGRRNKAAIDAEYALAARIPARMLARWLR